MNILHIPDLHIPYQHKNALRFACRIRDKYKINKVIFGGDVFDQYSMSRYGKDPDALTANKEFDLAKKEVTRWVHEFPVADITTGNHDIRLHKRLVEIGIPPKLLIKTFNGLWDLPDTWKWGFDKEVDNIRFIHGVKSGQNAHYLTAKDYRQSVVLCHTHSTLGINHMAGPRDSIFAMNTGCLIDDKSLAFSYAKDFTSRPVLGCGVIINGEPHVIRMV